MRGPDLHLPTQKSVLRNKTTDSFINTTLFKQNKQAEDFQRRILLKSEYIVVVKRWFWFGLIEVEDGGLQ